MVVLSSCCGWAEKKERKKKERKAISGVNTIANPRPELCLGFHLLFSPVLSQTVSQHHESRQMRNYGLFFAFLSFFFFVSNLYFFNRTKRCIVASPTWDVFL